VATEIGPGRFTVRKEKNLWVSEPAETLWSGIIAVTKTGIEPVDRS
jgi:hypothetical protein